MPPEQLSTTIYRLVDRGRTCACAARARAGIINLSIGQWLSALSNPSADRILDAAEARIRAVGYNGFSFRDLAEDVGIKSASVHYHFPTKEQLVATLVDRYGDRFLDALAEAPTGLARLAAYRQAFRTAVGQDLNMCLCGVLGAEQATLPSPVAERTRRFFERVIDHLAAGLHGHIEDPRDTALAAVAQLEGAVILARAAGRLEVFDRAAARLCGEREESGP